MFVVSRRIFLPHPGMEARAIDRSKQLVAAMNRLGAKARVLRVLMGADADNLEIFARYDHFRHGIGAFQSFSQDAEIVALRAEYSADPAGTSHGPYVYRSVFGEASTQPVLVQRSYRISRERLAEAIALLPAAREAIGPTAGMSSVVPVFSPEMDQLVVTYYVDSLEHLGAVLDDFAMAPAFQAVAAKAASLGTLYQARVLQVL